MRILYILLLLPIFNFAQIPFGYYDDADGLEGENLRTALYNIIKDHNVESYNDLWTDFQTTDKKANGKVWDMYSIHADGTANYEYSFVSDQCGNYSGEGSCYNREHSFPKSWFNDASPMYTDLFHLYPTDGYTNSMRSNYPYGEVGSATWTSTNGSKKGNNVYPGYSGTVFEPIDEFKGDFARTYFYMVTRYKNIVSNWNSDMLTDDNLSTWATNMLMDWAEADPVSQKELDRNNNVYDIQNNRNPFIDHPEYICLIWGSNCDAAIYNYTNASFTVFPNPAENYFQLNLTNPKVTVSSIEIYSITGELIFVDTDYCKNEKYDISNFEKGIYIINILTNKVSITKKLTVN